jgi:hypothetical protein
VPAGDRCVSASAALVGCQCLCTREPANSASPGYRECAVRISARAGFGRIVSAGSGPFCSIRSGSERCTMFIRQLRASGTRFGVGAPSASLSRRIGLLSGTDADQCHPRTPLELCTASESMRTAAQVRTARASYTNELFLPPAGGVLPLARLRGLHSLLQPWPSAPPAHRPSKAAANPSV